MIDLLKSLHATLRIGFLRRNEFYSLELRSMFREKFDIDVGLYSYGCFDRWRMPGPLKVGRYCSMAKTVRSTNNNHPLDALTTSPVLYHSYFGVIDEDKAWEGGLVIEDDVWIGHNVVILPGCRRIGRGAIIGAGAIVTRDVDRYAVMTGNPARKLRDRFPPDLADAIEATRWWELDVSELRNIVKADEDVVFHPSVTRLEASGLTSWRRSRGTAMDARILDAN